MSSKTICPKDMYIYSRINDSNKSNQNTGKCITRKMTDEEKIKHCCCK